MIADSPDTNANADTSATMHDGSGMAVKLAELAPPRITVKCRECGTVTRVYRVIPVTQLGEFKYCPLCGSRRVLAFQSASTDHWEALARDYNMPVDVIQQVYDVWEPHKVPSFRDFVQQLKQEASDATHGVGG